MNKLAFRTTGLLIKALYSLSKAKFNLHDEKNVPETPTIFVVNHFTRLETFLFPLVLFKLTKKPIWSLAAADLFKGAFGEYLENVGAISNRAPNRDELMVKTLLTGEANWIIFPEGRMVKSKKIFERGRYLITYAGGKHPPHSGAATLALRTEFYRRRLRFLHKVDPPESERLLRLFQIDSIDRIQTRPVTIVPVNISYYPLRARENILSKMAVSLMGHLPERLIEELMTEGEMLLSGVDIDIRFGSAIDILPSIEKKEIAGDIYSRNHFSFDDAIPSLKTMRQESLNIMNRYMKMIYEMTTVNHDHLFASVLKRFYGRKMRENDFKRRVFLITRKLDACGDIYRHQSLESNQVPLITDDRYDKYGDFIDIAVESGVVETKEGWILKNISRFNTVRDYTRIRIDNPIAVMANDIEPLLTLQRLIRRVSRHPAWSVRRRVAEVLLKDDMALFESDYRTHFNPAESKQEKIGRPYLLGSRSRQTGILLIHGYMAGPAEVRELARYLNRLGFWVYGVRLRGHGTTPEDLAQRRYQDWIQSVDTGYALISSLCRHVIVGGFSAGGGLALEIGTRIPGLKGVFSVCPPMRLKNSLAKIAGGMDVIGKTLRKIRMGSLMKMFVENRPEHPDINYLRNPVSGVHQLELLMDMVYEKAEMIKMPAMVVQAQGDPVVDPPGSEMLFKKIGSEEKEYRPVAFNRHGILLGDNASEIHQIIGAFCQRRARDTLTPR